MLKIFPCLCFESSTKEAVKLYTELFMDSSIEDEIVIAAGPAKGSPTIEFKIHNSEFEAFDGGPYFKFSPAVSISINVEDEEYLTKLWNKLIDGGSSLMPFQSYDFSKKYGWLNDKFGVSWQLNYGKTHQVVSPSFMFIGKNFGRAEEAINFYSSIFKDSSVDGIYRYGDEMPQDKGKIAHAEFRLNNQSFIALESSMDHQFEITQAISMVVLCETQEEVDFYWDKLSEGGWPEQCGWLKDKFGISWQIVPKKLIQLLKDPAKAVEATDAMLEMVKLDFSRFE